MFKIKIEHRASGESKDSILSILKLRCAQKYTQAVNFSRKGKTIIVTSQNLDSAAIYDLIDNSPLQVWETYEESELFGEKLMEADSFLSNKLGKKHAFIMLLVPALVKDEKDKYQFKKGPCLGYVAPGDTDELKKYFDLIIKEGILPSDFKIVWYQKRVFENKYIAVIAVKKAGELTFSNFKKLKISPYEDECRLYITLNSGDSLAWQGFTERNIDRSIAITFNSIVYDYPKVLKKIVLGSLFISDKDETVLRDLEIKLRYPLLSTLQL